MSAYLLRLDKIKFIQRRFINKSKMMSRHASLIFIIIVTVTPMALQNFSPLNAVCFILKIDFNEPTNFDIIASRNEETMICLVRPSFAFQCRLGQAG